MKDDIEKIERKITAAVQEWNMFADACPIVVGLSGGADSIALTHLLMRRAVPRGHSLIAAHVNHELRRNRMSSLSVPFAVGIMWSFGFSARISGALRRSAPRELRNAGAGSAILFSGACAQKAAALQRPTHFPTARRQC